MQRLWGSFVLALSGAIVVAGPAAQADSVADFYRGKTVSVVIGYSAGGGYDVYARALARFMPLHIPGSPTNPVDGPALDKRVAELYATPKSVVEQAKKAVLGAQ
jgi:hypothetical protein